jgi:hypothetical protein
VQGLELAQLFGHRGVHGVTRFLAAGSQVQHQQAAAGGAGNGTPNALPTGVILTGSVLEKAQAAIAAAGTNFGQTASTSQNMNNGAPAKLGPRARPGLDLARRVRGA